jgi:hypothetical protein
MEEAGPRGKYREYCYYIGHILIFPQGPFNKRKRGANDNHDEEGPGATPPLAPPSKRQKEGKFR